MQGEMTEQDYKEFEVLLGEIPNATSESHRAAESSGLSAWEPVLNNFCNSPQASKRGNNVSFYDGLTFSESSHQRFQDQGNVDISVSDHETPVANVHRDKSDLLDDQSLMLAFKQFNFRDDVSTIPTSPAIVTSANSSLRLNEFPSVPSVPPFPVSPNEVNISNAAVNGYHPLMGTSQRDRISGVIRQGDAAFKQLNICEPKQQRPEIRMEHLRSFPTYPSEMPVEPGMHRFQFLPGIPAQELEIPAPAFQKQYYMDVQSPSYATAQHFSQPDVAWQNMEDAKFIGLPSQHVHPQHLQNQQTELHQIRNSSIRPFTGNIMQPHIKKLIPCQTRGSLDANWNGSALSSEYNQLDLACNGLCRYYPQELSDGQKLHSPCARTCSAKSSHGHHDLNKVGKQIAPERILTRSHGVNSLRTLKSDSTTSNQLLRTLKSDSTTSNQLLHFADGNGRAYSNGYVHCPFIERNITFKVDDQDSRNLSPDSSDFRHASKSLQLKYNSVDEVVGKIYPMAKDQHGCRFLQKKITEGTSEDVEKIFTEIVDCTVELMTDPFGNYLVQKLLDVCNEGQRMHILHKITRTTGVLTEISCDMHGTRAVQRLIETLRLTEQFSMIASSLKPDALSLIKDINGNHVALRCLQYLSSEYKEFLFDAATDHCVELATDRQGCCVLQKCLYHSDGEQKRRLMSEITSNALILSQDPFGNYVVQYILDQEVPWATASILDQLEGSYGSLSMQKYGSNVVEKCIKFAKNDKQAKIIRELMNAQLLKILQDQYGNYVAQSALKECKGALHAAFVEAIKPHLPLLRSSPYGRKFLSSTYLKK